MTEHLLASLGLYCGTLVTCFVAGLVPLVNAEVFLVGVSMWAVTSTSQLPLVALCAAVGQMTAKVLLYYAGMGMIELPRGRFRERLERARSKIERWRKRPYLVYAISATVGLPPFYLVSLAAGALRIGFSAFCAIGLAGRFLRFAIVVALPHLRG
jgi:membrane protein YqaA with SNARE-associated domain